MKNTRKIITLIAILAVIVCLSVVALAENEEFSFELPKDFVVKEVIIKSEKSGEHKLSEELKAAYAKYDEKITPWDIYGGEKMAEFVAYDRYSKGKDYTAAFDEKNGYVTFDITGPTVILFPSKIQLPVEDDLDFCIYAVDIPDGIAVEYSYGENDAFGGITVIKYGIGRFSIPYELLKDMQPGQALKFTFKFIVDGKEYEEVMYVLGEEGDKIITGPVQPANPTKPTDPANPADPAEKTDGEFHGLEFTTPFGKFGFTLEDEWFGLKQVIKPFVSNKGGELGVDIGGGTEDTQFRATFMGVVDAIKKMVDFFG